MDKVTLIVVDGTNPPQDTTLEYRGIRNDVLVETPLSMMEKPKCERTIKMPCRIGNGVLVISEKWKAFGTLEGNRVVSWVEVE